MPDEMLAFALRAKPRRNILHLLCDNKKRTVHDIAKLVKLSVTATSKHLRILADYGILGIKQDPPLKYYFLLLPEIKELVELYDIIVEKMPQKAQKNPKRK